MIKPIFLVWTNINFLAGVIQIQNDHKLLVNIAQSLKYGAREALVHVLMGSANTVSTWEPLKSIEGSEQSEAYDQWLALAPNQ